METITTKLYEGMFLVDAARAGSDWDGVISTIRKILDRVGAEIVSIKKWDDRKLAYDIKGQSRGVYILCYFRVDGTKIREIENSIHLSEQIMRVLILNAEQMTQEDIDKETPAAKAEQEGVKTEEEFYMVEAAAKIYSRPAIDFTTQQWQVDHLDVAGVSLIGNWREHGP